MRILKELRPPSRSVSRLAAFKPQILRDLACLEHLRRGDFADQEEQRCKSGEEDAALESDGDAV